jgi:4-hydroxybenzoate polyprenyltransferase
MLQMIGVLLAIPEGTYFLTVYIFSMLFFWLYSTPWARWKSRPLKSLIAIGISTGFNSVLLGYLAAGNTTVPLLVFVAALGVSLLLLSLYPISQIYQQDEDTRRGDQTFAIQYGVQGVRRFYVAGYFGGLLLISTVLITLHSWLGLIFGIIGVVTGVIVLRKLNKLTAQKGDYYSVMWIKYSTSLAFVGFLICALFLKHSGIQQVAQIAEILLQ